VKKNVDYFTLTLNNMNKFNFNSWFSNYVIILYICNFFKRTAADRSYQQFGPNEPAATTAACPFSSQHTHMEPRDQHLNRQHRSNQKIQNR
jgi:hypothetical protein